jgi:uncharacterized LabA/DUF88 family protein
MNHDEIRQFLASYENIKERTITIVDFSNVEKWKNSLGWEIGIQELAKLVKHFSYGNQTLRRFYYGSDYGPNEKSNTMIPWSENMIYRADINRFEVVTKRVKYIKNQTNTDVKKCDLDVEMAVDLLKFESNFDQAVIFSGDGDLTYAMQYLYDNYGKTFIVFAARNHVSKEVIDCSKTGVISRILFAEDFDYRLMNKHKHSR